MAGVVSLKAVAEEMGVIGGSMHSFLNIHTGELFTVPEEVMNAAIGESDYMLPDWDEDMAKVNSYIASIEWVQLPQTPAYEAHAMMQEFALTQCEGRLQDNIQYAIQGKGAFARFRNIMRKWDCEDRWLKFREREYLERAKHWLESNGINYEP